jgi:hypothetical protein
VVEDFVLKISRQAGLQPSANFLSKRQFLWRVVQIHAASIRFSTTVQILHEDLITPWKVNQPTLDQWREASKLTSRQGTCLIDIGMKNIRMNDCTGLRAVNR